MIDLNGRTVTVFDRYLFAVPVRGVITGVSEKDGAYQVTFFSGNPGGENVTKHNGKFFHHQQCRLEGTPNPEQKVTLKMNSDNHEMIELYETSAKGTITLGIAHSDFVNDRDVLARLMEGEHIEFRMEEIK